MNAFAAWGLSILGLAVITTIAEMLLPRGKMRNVIRSVTATVAALVIITPLPKIFKDGANFDFFGDDAVETDSEYLEYIEETKCKLISNAARDYLAQKGYDGVEITVTLDGFKVKSATANIVETGITGDDGHINKSEIKKLLAEYFGIDKEAVMAYG